MMVRCTIKDPTTKQSKIINSLDAIFDIAADDPVRGPEAL